MKLLLSIEIGRQSRWVVIIKSVEDDFQSV